MGNFWVFVSIFMKIVRQCESADDWMIMEVTKQQQQYNYFSTPHILKFVLDEKFQWNAPKFSWHRPGHSLGKKIK